MFKKGWILGALLALCLGGSALQAAYIGVDYGYGYGQPGYRTYAYYYPPYYYYPYYQPSSYYYYNYYPWWY